VTGCRIIRYSGGRGEDAPDLASKRAGWLDVAVLGRDLDVLADGLKDRDQIECMRGDDNLWRD